MSLSNKRLVAFEQDSISRVRKLTKKEREVIERLDRAESLLRRAFDPNNKEYDK